jgi:hypothetical protein
LIPENKVSHREANPKETHYESLGSIQFFYQASEGMKKEDRLHQSINHNGT